MAELDVQPVLDVQPATNAPALDVQPVDAPALDVQPVAPAPDLSHLQMTPVHQASAYSQGMEPDSDFLRSVANDPKGFLKSLPGDALSVAGGLSALPYKAAADVVSKVFNDPEFGGNLKQLAEDPEGAAPSDNFLASVAKTNPAMAVAGKLGAGIAESAPMAGVGGLPVAAQRAIVGGFTADMLYHAPITAHELYTELQKPKDQQDPDKITSLISDGVQQIGFGALGALHLAGGLGDVLAQKYVPSGAGVRNAPPLDVRPAEPKMPANNTNGTNPAGSETVSEFGGDVAATPAAPNGAPPASSPAVAPTNLEASTVPESPDTLLAQIKWLQAGKRQAVLFTHPDQKIPEFLTDEQDGKFSVQDTPAGRVLFDTAQLTGDQVSQAVAANKVGDILGYGISDKPAQGTEIGAVTIRDSQGREKQSVATDEANLPSVILAAQKLLDDGDKITLEKPEQVIAARQAAATPAVTPESERIRMARENVQAMAALRGQKAEGGSQTETPVALDVRPVETAPRPTVDVVPTEKAVKAAAEKTARPDDILDSVQALFPRGVKFDPDQIGDQVRTARGAAADLMSHTKGEPSDLVLQGLHEQGLYTGIKTETDLAEEMKTAGEARMNQRGAASSQARQLATEAGRAELFGKAVSTERPGETEPLPANQLFVGDTFKLKGQPVQVTEHVIDAETGDPAGIHVEGAYGKQFIPADATIHLDKGTLENAPFRPAGLTGETGDENIRKAIDEKHQSINKNAGAGGDAGRRVDDLRRQQAGAALFGRVSRGKPKALGSASFDADYANTEHGRTLQNVAAAHGTNVVFYRAAGKAPDGFFESGTIFVRSDLTRSEITDTFEHELAHQQDAAGNTRLRILKASANLDSPAAITIRAQYDAWRKSVGLPPLTDKRFREELAAFLTEGTRVFGVDVSRAWRNPQAALNMAREYHQSRPARGPAASGETQFSPDRQRWERIQASPVVSDQVKELLKGDGAYEVRRFSQIQDEARSIVQARGVDGAIDLFKANDPNMPADTRTALGALIQEQLRSAEQAARAAGDSATADQLASKQVEVWRADAYGTEMAQGLNARKLYDAMSPAGILEAARKTIGEAGEKQWQRVKPAIDAVKKVLTQANGEAVGDLRQDPETNQAARQAVNAAVKDSPATQRAVIAELGQEWAEADPTGVILKQAREQLHERAQAVWNAKPGLGLAPSARIDLRNLLDDMAKRAAGIFGAHMQGAEPGVPIVDKFMQRLGLDRPHAVKLASALGKEWDAQLKAAKERLDQRIINQRARQQKGLTAGATDPAVDRAIRQQLADLNVKLGELVRQTSSQVDTTGKSIGQRILQASGLQGEAATKMAETIDRRFNTLATAKKQQLLKAMEQQRAVAGMKRVTPSAVDKLIKLSNLGAFSDSQFYDLAKTALKLPVLTDELAAQIVKGANELQTMPEGVLRDRKATQLLNMAARAGVKWTDIPMGIFYANILSGFTTPAKIVFENTNMLIGNTLASMVARPGQVMRNPVDFVTNLAKAYGRGIVKGGLQAESTLRTGIVTGITKEIHPASVMELKPFGEKMDVVNFWKWFGRIISTGHETTFKPAWEVKSTLIAQDVARSEGLTGGALQQRVADILANTDAHVDAARTQAAAELGPDANRLDVARRVREIIEQKREANLPGITEASRDFALRTAYLNDPYGFLGLIAKGIRNTLQAGREQFPVVGTVTKTQIPFTTIVANIINEKLNWTPVGFLRATIAGKTGELYGREMLDSSERSELYAKAIIGTVALSSLATLFGSHIHGNGPSNPAQRAQLQATGWIPHSIELDGKFFSYMNTPLALGLAVIGNTIDWSRYGKGDDAGAVDRFAFAAKATMNAIVSQGMLDSVKRIFDALGDESTTQGGQKLEKLAARTAASFIVPNLLQQIDRLFDPTQYDQSSMKALLTSQIPFVRRDNKPALNVLGEPVQSGPFHYWASEVTSDPLWKILAAKQAWVPEPSRNQIIGDKSKGEGYYRAMTPDEYYNWIAQTGPEIRMALTDDLDKIALATPADAKKIVTKIAEQIRRQDKPTE